MSASESKWAFFKQGGWMVMATGISGVFMILVHSVASKHLDAAEYALFGALIKFFLFMGIPANGLQTVFAQQAAAAVNARETRQLARLTQVVLAATFGLWLLAGAGILIFAPTFSSALKITSFAALLCTVLLGLPALWMPLFKGLLQGRQHFAGLGLVAILDGVIRLGAVCGLVFALHGQAASVMTAALLGQVAAISVGAWITRDLWLGHGEPFAWRPWLKTVIPLSVGGAAVSFVFLADSQFVQNLFADERRSLYVAGQNSGFALSQITVPLSLVMFPKIARSLARSEKSDALALTLKSTLGLGGLVALACTVMPSLPLRVVYFFSFEKVAAATVLIPWSVWTLLALSVANVLAANLLARKAFAIVPWLVVLALGYGLTLWGAQAMLLRMELLAAFRTVIQIQLLFSVLLLGVSIYYSRKQTSGAA
jgi:O-antigen/teichoic acid export membrane protein